MYVRGSEGFGTVNVCIYVEQETLYRKLFMWNRKRGTVNVCIYIVKKYW